MSSSPAFLQGGGACGALIRSIDWSRTPVGAPEHWPENLKSTVAMILLSRHPMFLWWGKDLIQFYNDAYLPSFGVGKHPAAMGQRGADCWQEIWPIIWPQIADVMEHRSASLNEDHLVPIFRNGVIEEVYWTYGYSPIVDPDGRVAGTLVVCTETTSRVISERRLRSAHALADALGRSTDTPALLAHIQGVFAHFRNDIPFSLLYFRGEGGEPALQAATGLAPAEARRLDERLREMPAGDALRDLPADRTLRLPEGVATAPWPEPVDRLYLVPFGVGTAGEGLVVFGTSPRLPLDEPYRSYLDDLAERISQALDRLRSDREREGLLNRLWNEEDRLKRLFDEAPAFACVLEGERHVFALANERYYQLVGRRDLIGKPLAEALPELAGQGYVQLLDEVYRTGESYLGHDQLVHLARLGGDSTDARYVDFVYQAVRGADGRITGILVHGVDQTERRRATQALEQADRRKDQFIALLAHELRNPLAPIANYVEVLGRSADDPAAVRQAMAVMGRQVKQIVRLTDDLLDVSRISTGKIDLRLASADMAAVVRQAAEAALPYFDERGVVLVTALADEPLHVHADTARLGQVIGNLLHNAAKFTAAGGRVELKAAREAGEVVVRVRDSGIGMAQDTISDMFNMFTQGDISIERVHGGLGIGLALVRTLVELHGGRVEARSGGAGHGSEFWFSLPEAATPAESGASGEVHRDAAARRVLVIDDNRDACDSMAELLRASGHVVTTAYDGVTGIEAGARERPELVFLDLGMPRMSGYEVCRRMRSEPWSRDTLIIALTGWGQAEDKRRTQQAGFDGHLVKPVDVALLDEVLARRRGDVRA